MVDLGSGKIPSTAILPFAELLKAVVRLLSVNGMIDYRHCYSLVQGIADVIDSLNSRAPFRTSCSTKEILRVAFRSSGTALRNEHLVCPDPGRRHRMQNQDVVS